MDRRLTVDERCAAGRQARPTYSRDNTPSGHSWPDRHSPVAIIQSQNEHRVPGAAAHPARPDGVSPFTFYRGAAAIMAEDLSSNS